MIEGGMDRPGVNHIVRNVVSIGGKPVFLDTIQVAFSGAGTTGSWQELDLSSYIPDGSLGAIIELYISANNLDRYIAVDKKGRQDAKCLATYIASETSYANANQGVVPVDSDRKIEYYLNGNATIGIWIVGYIIPVGQR